MPYAHVAQLDYVLDGDTVRGALQLVGQHTGGPRPRLAAGKAKHGGREERPSETTRARGEERGQGRLRPTGAPTAEHTTYTSKKKQRHTGVGTGV